MKLKPTTQTELSSMLARASSDLTPIAAVDLTHFDQIVEHCREDLTATVQTGMRFQSFQETLEKHGQWLPLDPPPSENLTVLDVLNHDLTGPRRYAFGKARDYVLGLKVVLADGTIIRTGGKVVKNVAGYDLGKLFIGAGGSLGILIEATFKLLPRPRSERFLYRTCASGPELQTTLAAIKHSPLRPSVMDCCRLEGLPASGDLVALVLGFSGTSAEVESQTSQAAGFGFCQAIDLDYDRRFWSSRARESVRTLSVTPKSVASTIKSLLPSPFLCRAGNGIIYMAHSGESAVSPENTVLEHRTKKTFDPNHILPRLPSRL